MNPTALPFKLLWGRKEWLLARAPIVHLELCGVLETRAALHTLFQLSTDSFEEGSWPLVVLPLLLPPLVPSLPADAHTSVDG